MLRNVLRNHPNLAAPEETHFFRWAEPFGGVIYRKVVSENRILKHHREMDGIEESEFQEILDESVSRADLYHRYMQLYIKKNKPEAGRWFDKTPQNIYGAAMIASEMVNAKFVHIVRDPLDVVSSLRIGIIIKVENLVGACCYWNEAADNIHVLKKAFPGRVYEVKYEDFTREPMAELNNMMAFLEEPYDPEHFVDINIVPKTHEHETLFTEKEITRIRQLCRRWGTHYGYFSSP